jgi:hypothetical protein
MALTYITPPPQAGFWALAALMIASNCVTAQQPSRLASIRWDEPALGQATGNGINGNDVKPPEPPKTLFKWNLLDVPEQREDEPKEDVISTDRPDFTEASNTVGLGRIQFENGFTYTRSRLGGTHTHRPGIHTYSFPEGLLRIGMFAEWFEWRLGWTYLGEQTSVSGQDVSAWGGSDLYFGAKLFLTEQAGCFPEMSVNLQTFIPAGAREFRTNRILPGVNWLYGWDLTDWLSFAGSTQFNRAVDDTNHDYLLGGQSLTIGYTFNKRWGAYTEWFVIFPHGAVEPDLAPEHYFNGGFTYKPTNNIQLDIRAGVGLNQHAADYFVGVGSAFRF